MGIVFKVNKIISLSGGLRMACFNINDNYLHLQYVENKRSWISQRFLSWEILIY